MIATESGTRWIYPRTAADRLGVDVRTIYRWIRDGWLDSRNVGVRKTRVSAASVERLIERQSLERQGEW